MTATPNPPLPLEDEELLESSLDVGKDGPSSDGDMLLEKSKLLLLLLLLMLLLLLDDEWAPSKRSSDPPAAEAIDGARRRATRTPTPKTMDRGARYSRVRSACSG